MARSEIPRWIVQDPVQFNNVGTDKIKPVTNQDLKVAAEMYGKVSKTFFEVAHTQSMVLAYLRKDFSELYASEAYQAGTEAIEKLKLDPEATTDAQTFRKTAAPIIDDVTKGMGYYEQKEVRRQFNNQIIDIAQNITKDQINSTIAATQKQKTNDWDITKQKYFSEIDPNWGNEEKEYFRDSLKLEQRKTLNFLPEEQQVLLDKELDKEFKVYSVLNNFTKEGAYNDPKIRKDMLESTELKEIFENPETKDIANSVMKNFLSLQDSKRENAKLFNEFKVNSRFEQFKTQHDNIQSAVKRYEFYKNELFNGRKRGEPVEYMQKLVSFGDTLGYGIPRAGFGFFMKTAGGEDEWFRMGLNSEIDLRYVDSLYINGSINRKQLNAAKAGLTQRDQAYNKFDKRFGEQVKAEFNIDIFSKKEKKPSILDIINDRRAAEGQESLLPGRSNPVNKELEKFIKEEKRALYGLNYENYVKGLDNLLVRARAKKIELDQQKMQQYGNEKKSSKMLKLYER